MDEKLQPRLGVELRKARMRLGLTRLRDLLRAAQE